MDGNGEADYWAKHGAKQLLSPEQQVSWNLWRDSKFGSTPKKSNFRIAFFPWLKGMRKGSGKRCVPKKSQLSHGLRASMLYASTK
eukprot:8343621-Pyramimonas_sp.AAC.1